MQYKMQNTVLCKTLYCATKRINNIYGLIFPDQELELGEERDDDNNKENKNDVF